MSNLRSTRWYDEVPTLSFVFQLLQYASFEKQKQVFARLQTYLQSQWFVQSAANAPSHHPEPSIYPVAVDASELTSANRWYDFSDESRLIMAAMKSAPRHVQREAAHQLMGMVVGLPNEAIETKHVV